MQYYDIKVGACPVPLSLHLNEGIKQGRVSDLERSAEAYRIPRCNENISVPSVDSRGVNREEAVMGMCYFAMM